MQRKRILIIDDDPLFTGAVKKALEHERGYEVAEQNDPAWALFTALEQQPALIFLGVFLMGIDGGEIAAELRRHPQTQAVPIVFVATRSHKYKGAAGPAWFAGFPFIAKPTTRQALLRCLEKILPSSVHRSGFAIKDSAKRLSDGKDPENPTTPVPATDPPV